MHIIRYSNTGSGTNNINITVTGSYDPATLDEDFAEVMKKAEQILQEKRQTYTGSRGPLENFRRAGLIMQCTPERALQGMLMKHLVFLFDVIDEIEATKQTQNPLDTIDEKIIDTVNYLILLRKMIRERIEKR